MAEDMRKEQTIGTLMREGRKKLVSAGIENAAGEVRDIMMHLLGIDSSKLFMAETETVNAAIGDMFSSIIEKRCTHYPLQYLLGSTCFMGYDFLCRENVLIPRFDTENLVAAAVDAGADRALQSVWIYRWFSWLRERASLYVLDTNRSSYAPLSSTSRSS